MSDLFSLDGVINFLLENNIYVGETIFWLVVGLYFFYDILLKDAIKLHLVDRVRE